LSNDKEGLVFNNQIVRNEIDSLKVHSGTYYSIEVLDIRWYKDDKPTRKGVRLNKKEAKILLNILEEILGD
tara:strand:+ start:280 stop:492 length:213 start_codon:yes stop_codon:yes gene_type:complete